VNGYQFSLLLKQDSAGGRTASFTNVKWPNNTAPTISTTIANMDVINFFSDGNYWYGYYSNSQNFDSYTGQDRYYNNVSLLLHMDGSGNTFTDFSGTPKTITVGGNATQSATQSKFGGKSAKLANGDYLSVISSTVLTEANNYVLEFWFYPLSQTQDDRIFAIENSSGDTRGLIIDGGQFCWNKFGFPDKPLTGSLTNNQWQHIAIVKSSSTTSLYISGTRTSTTTSTLFPTNPTRINWGASITNYTLSQINAYYDDIRITLGTDRGYTGSTITIPTSAFSNSF
ncbi:hypothetical protein EB077_11920, partial [bacterium]|nr:hypothetical protein [bacterium]